MTADRFVKPPPIFQRIPAMPYLGQSGRPVTQLVRTALTAALVAASIWAAHSSRMLLEALATRRAWESHTLRMVDLGRCLVADVGEARGAIRDFDVSADPSDRARSAASRRRFEADFAAIASATLDNPEQARKLALVRSIADSVFANLDRGDHDSIVPFARLRAAVARVVDEETSLLPARVAAVDETLGEMKASSATALVVAGLLALDMLARAAIAHRESRRAPGPGGGE
jgi:hypothetical protein